MCHVGTPKRAVLAVYGASLPDPHSLALPVNSKHSVLMTNRKAHAINTHHCQNVKLATDWQVIDKIQTLTSKRLEGSV